jgi:hypothetical protein
MDRFGSSPRKINGLLRASLVPRPSHIPVNKPPKGSARHKGLLYELKAVKRLMRELPNLNLYYHQWIEYVDASGRHHCEPEVFAVLPNEVLLAEVKLTGNTYAVEQMSGLYAPLLSHLFQRPVRCLQICHSVSPHTPGPFVDGPAQFLATKLPQGTWQFLGR